MLIKQTEVGFSVDHQDVLTVFNTLDAAIAHCREIDPEAVLSYENIDGTIGWQIVNDESGDYIEQSDDDIVELVKEHDEEVAQEVREEITPEDKVE